MHPKIQMYLEARANAVARGDDGVIRAINADLARIGYVEPAAPAPAPRRRGKAEAAAA